MQIRIESRAFAAAAFALAAALFGCGGGPSPRPAVDEGPWEVTVISGEDTVAVPTEEEPGKPGVGRVVGIDPSAVDAEWEVTVEGDVSEERRAGAAASSGAASTPAAEPAREAESPASAATKPRAPRAPGESLDTEAFTFGYRIQLLATSSLVLAEQEAARADSLLAQPVYVEYEPPFYKVRVGDFLIRDDAQTALADEVSRRYEQAWLTETMVRRPRR